MSLNFEDMDNLSKDILSVWWQDGSVVLHTIGPHHSRCTVSIDPRDKTAVEAARVATSLATSLSSMWRTPVLIVAVFDEDGNDMRTETLVTINVKESVS
jgi:hypothetical protein